MASSSSAKETVSGTIMLVNVYLSKTDPATVFGDLLYWNLTQAYMHHNPKQNLDPGVSVWDRPSNTLGLALASCKMRHALQFTFPRICENRIVMHFIPDVFATAEFTVGAFNDVSKMDGEYVKDFYMGVQVALKCFQITMKGRRQETRYVGRCLGDIESYVQTRKET